MATSKEGCLFLACEQINQNLTNLKNNDMCIIKIYEIAPSCFEDLKDGISIQMT